MTTLLEEEQEILELREANKATAKTHAFNRLSRRECSSKDIYTHLVRKGASPETANAVVSELVEKELISDERFAKMLIRHLSSGGKGPSVIRQKLKEKGISMDLPKVRELTQDLTATSELDAAKKIAERRYPKAIADPGQSAVDPKEKNRAIQGLLRRGYSYSVAKDALKK